ncbi:hypothetical protein QTJ16_001440 [Diplocarpon rosae]|uniref:Uncharacterized protein n=1 Tax=Diplocarpon rosae TaxID=946125 RepID=A0AAD9T8G2_9HELO|nr:hypothetical protein QTJ16_001440 [Diplocarpon rosae]
MPDIDKHKISLRKPTPNPRPSLKRQLPAQNQPHSDISYAPQPCPKRQRLDKRQLKVVGQAQSTSPRRSYFQHYDQDIPWMNGVYPPSQSSDVQCPAQPPLTGQPAQNQPQFNGAYALCQQGAPKHLPRLSLEHQVSEQYRQQGGVANLPQPSPKRRCLDESPVEYPMMGNPLGLWARNQHQFGALHPSQGIDKSQRPVEYQSPIHVLQSYGEVPAQHQRQIGVSFPQYGPLGYPSPATGSWPSMMGQQSGQHQAQAGGYSQNLAQVPAQGCQFSQAPATGFQPSPRCQVPAQNHSAARVPPPHQTGQIGCASPPSFTGPPPTQQPPPSYGDSHHLVQGRPLCTGSQPSPRSQLPTRGQQSRYDFNYPRFSGYPQPLYCAPQPELQHHDLGVQRPLSAEQQHQQQQQRAYMNQMRISEWKRARN